MEDLLIRVAGAADVPQVRTVVARALADDPMIRWLLPAEVPDRLSRVAVFFSAQVERLVLLGHADVAELDGQVVGAALWIPPGAGRLDGLPVAAELAGIVAPGERVRAFADQFVAARQGAPTCDGPYLATLGVLDSCRGRGIGQRLLQAGHDHFGEVTTWLESTNPANLSLYRRAGYVETHRAGFADDATVMTRMVRSVQVPTGSPTSSGTTGVVLRTNDPIDDAALDALHAAAFGGKPSGHPWADRLGRHSLFWVAAQLDGRLVGFVNVLGDGGAHAVLLDTCVAPDVQGRGIGRMLVQHAADEARARGCHWLHADYEPGLVGFYEEVCGLRRTGAGLLALE